MTLLASHLQKGTTLLVVPIMDGAPIEREHTYMDTYVRT